MFQLAQSMNMRAIYKGCEFNFEGIRAKVMKIYDKNGVEMLSALCNIKKSKFNFLTKSC